MAQTEQFGAKVQSKVITPQARRSPSSLRSLSRSASSCAVSLKRAPEQGAATWPEWSPERKAPALSGKRAREKAMPNIVVHTIVIARMHVATAERGRTGQRPHETDRTRAIASSGITAHSPERTRSTQSTNERESEGSLRNLTLGAARRNEASPLTRGATVRYLALGNRTSGAISSWPVRPGG